MSRLRKDIKLVTKAEALQMLATHMRSPKLTANELLKLISIQSKIGWDKEDEPPKDNLKALVEAVERKRKQQVASQN